MHILADILPGPYMYIQWQGDMEEYLPFKDSYKNFQTLVSNFIEDYNKPVQNFKNDFCINIETDLNNLQHLKNIFFVILST